MENLESVISSKEFTVNAKLTFGLKVNRWLQAEELEDVEEEEEEAEESYLCFFLTVRFNVLGTSEEVEEVAVDERAEEAPVVDREVLREPSGRFR